MENKRYVLTEELYTKAKECKSAGEIMALARENDIELGEEQAKEVFAKLNPVNGEVADNELDNVAGGGCDLFDGGVCEVCGSDKVTTKWMQDENGRVRQGVVCAACGTFWRWA